MNPLVTTVRALKEITTGISIEAIYTSPILFLHEGKNAEVLIAAGDAIDEQRVIIHRDNQTREPFVPDHLARQEREVLARMTSFAERARSGGQLNLPRGWHQYKYKNLIAFFASSGGDSDATRWIAEITGGDRHDVAFLAATTSARKETLEQFDKGRDRKVFNFDEDWSSGFSEAAIHFAQANSRRIPDVEMSLPTLEFGATKGWTYEQWLSEISEDQRMFIEAPTDKSIRLRGPAGSGKTLAITLKAIREVLTAREAGDELRVLLVTHSWSLASEISDSISSLNMGHIAEIDVFPLLEIAQSISPQYVNDESGFSLIGNDSLSGKEAQLTEIADILDGFIRGDWITYKAGVSKEFAARFDADDVDTRFALAWDLLVEFGSVIGTAAIFPGAGAENRYTQLPRARWMLPLKTRQDLRVVFELYSRYLKSLEERSLLTSDQVLADLLNHLETHAWNRARKTQGYDLIFVDEFHLFSPLERQVIHYLSRDISRYPSVFMAVDPRQSPSEAFIGIASDETRSNQTSGVDGLGEIDNFELKTVHRFTPQILGLIKHLHLSFPTLDLGKDWDIDFSAVESSQTDGPIPTLTLATSSAGEGFGIAKAVHERYSAGRMALAVVDSRQWRRFSQLAAEVGTSGKFHVSTVSGRLDIEDLGYRRRGLVVGPAEYLAGLQFDTVLVAGIPDLHWATAPNERTRLLSLLYLAISRAEKEVRIFVNEDDGGIADVLQTAVSTNLLYRTPGTLV